LHKYERVGLTVFLPYRQHRYTGFYPNTAATVYRSTLVPFGDGFWVYWLLDIIAEQFSVLSVMPVIVWLSYTLIIMPSCNNIN